MKIEKVKNKGITLIALIITIIIMLILAGVVITLTIGENGLIKVARETKENYMNAEKKELADIEDLYSSMIVATGDDAKITISMDDLRNVVKKQVQEEMRNNIPMFIDTNNLITTITGQSASWIATEDCAVVCELRVTDASYAIVYVDGVEVCGICDQQAKTGGDSRSKSIIYVKKGSTITTRENYGIYTLRVYGLK